MPKFIYTQSPAEDGTITSDNEERLTLCVTDSPEVAGSKMLKGHDAIMAVPMMDAVALFEAVLKVHLCRSSAKEAIKSGLFMDSIEELERAATRVIR